ncbi:MAG: hypothetical protein DBX40_08260 [Clostridiales bacterium]|nr:MAG: hypothetical protein DBX40_08260 [Clostridiales bacterium]
MNYTPWLIRRGCLENYTELALVWDELDFVWYIPEDEDKAIQALRMRDEYCYETGMPSPRQAPPSFLEVFVSITDTLTAMLYQDRESFTKSILLNMGARSYSDDGRPLSEIRKESLSIAERVMYRTYSRNGTGGLFRIPGVDTLEMPLTTQMIKWANLYDPYH